MPVFNNPRRTPCFSTAPTQEDFEAIAAEALATIPEEFRRHVGNVRIQIDDFPSDEVLDELMAGRTLDDVCADPEMPSATSVRKWVRDDVDGFAARYFVAREIGYQSVADQALQIVDDRSNDWITYQREDGSIARMLDPKRIGRALARVSTPRWLLSKMLPKRFGERPDFYARREGANQTSGQAPSQTPSNDMIELMKHLGRRDRGLPSEEESDDEG